MWNNNFIESLDEQGCEHWERMLGISNKDTYTLEERRLKILGIYRATTFYCKVLGKDFGGNMW